MELMLDLCIDKHAVCESLFIAMWVPFISSTCIIALSSKMLFLMWEKSLSLPALRVIASHRFSVSDIHLVEEVPALPELLKVFKSNFQK
jgi:hypothetical protein